MSDADEIVPRETLLSAVSQIVDNETVTLRERIAELEREIKACMDYIAIESDETLLEAIKRNNDGWKERCEKAEARIAELERTLDGRRAALAQARFRAEEYHARIAELNAENDALTMQLKLKPLPVADALDQAKDIAELEAALADAQKVLRETVRGPYKPYPDPMAHSWRAYGEAVHAEVTRRHFLVLNYLSTIDAARHSNAPNGEKK